MMHKCQEPSERTRSWARLKVCLRFQADKYYLHDKLLGVEGFFMTNKKGFQTLG